MSEAWIACSAIAALLVGMLALAVLVCWLADCRRYEPEPSGPELALARADHLQRLRSPKFEELARAYQTAVPRALRELYERPELVLQERICLVDVQQPGSDSFVARFLPADARTVFEAWFGEWEDRFPFAEDDFGNYYSIPMTTERRPAADQQAVQASLPFLAQSASATRAAELYHRRLDVPGEPRALKVASRSSPRSFPTATSRTGASCPARFPIRLRPRVRRVVRRAWHQGQVQHRPLSRLRRLGRSRDARLDAARSWKQPQARPRLHAAELGHPSRDGHAHLGHQHQDRPAVRGASDAVHGELGLHRRQDRSTS
jgi:hypothetical protein